MVTVRGQDRHRRARRAGVAALAMLVGLPGCIGADPLPGPPVAGGGETMQRVDGPPDGAALMARARERGVLPVIVGLDVEITPEGNLDRAGVAAQRRAIAAAQARALGALGNPEGAVRFESVPFFSLVATPALLERVLALPGVVSVVEDVPLAPMGH